MNGARSDAGAVRRSRIAIGRGLGLGLGLAWVLAGGPVRAHKPSDSYLRLGEPIADGQGVRMALRWDLALRDLDRALGIDVDRDGAVSWGEVRRGDAAARALLQSHLGASLAGVRCAISSGSIPARIVRHSDGAYAVYAFTIACPRAGPRLEMDYSLLFDLDPQHRGLLRAAGEALVMFSRDARHAELALPSERPRELRLWSAIRQGVHHIWTGYDHLLFLLALLLPAVLRREDERWVPVDQLSSALFEVLKVVTAFTVAHSVTLSLAALGLLSLPSRLVESAIAASVVLAALNNLFPLLRADRWLAAFALGLLHGFGFSSTLADLGLEPQALLPTLVGFNLGVELGQAAVVACFVPLAFLARRRSLYRTGALQLGSLLIALVAAIWLCERAFGVVLISR